MEVGKALGWSAAELLTAKTIELALRRGQDIAAKGATDEAT